MKIINEYTRESGVRQLDRLIRKIIRKMITEAKMNKKDMPSSVSNKHLLKYLKAPIYSEVKNRNFPAGYARGIAFTPYGGATIDVEVAAYIGEEKIVTTGSLGKVMEESISVALGYIKSNAKAFGIDLNVFKNKTIHINFRETAVPKDGPSAGSLIVSALLSYFKGKSISSEISMTGEITLNGDLLPIGGLKEKSLAAIRSDVKVIFVPFENEKDVKELDKEIRDKVEFKVVRNYMDIYKYLFKNGDRR